MTALTSNHSLVNLENCHVGGAARNPPWPPAPPRPGDPGFGAPYLITFWPWGIPWGSGLQVMGKPQA